MHDVITFIRLRLNLIVRAFGAMPKRYRWLVLDRTRWVQWGAAGGQWCRAGRGGRSSSETVGAVLYVFATRFMRPDVAGDVGSRARRDGIRTG